MKKIRIILILITLAFLTGCSCEYDLKIDNNSYSESVTINGLSYDEINEFNSRKEIPVYKNSNGTTEENYGYFLTGNTYIFSHDFTRYDYSNSAAAEACFSTLVVSDYEDNIVISTNNGASCFSKYPSLSSVTVNINVDREVISNNADKVNGNIYTWNINKENASNKSINIIIDNSEVIEAVDETSTAVENNDKNSLFKPEMYIFAFVLLVVMLAVYALANAIKNQDDDMDSEEDDLLSDEDDE